MYRRAALPYIEHHIVEEGQADTFIGIAWLSSVAALALNSLRDQEPERNKETTTASCFTIRYSKLRFAVTTCANILDGIEKGQPLSRLFFNFGFKYDITRSRESEGLQLAARHPLFAHA